VHHRLSTTPLAGAAALLAATFARACLASGVEVTVTDERGQPIKDVAVYATPASGATAAKPQARPTAVMDQHDNRFVPHVLVVQTGTEVLFPNHDAVSHHVYSFSPAKTFELGLYKGTAYPPLLFDEPGDVVLGCNIHDTMLGYIKVVDTPYFALTDEHGRAEIKGLPKGDYRLEAWTPRARPAGLPGAQALTLGEAEASVALTVTGKLAPDYDSHSSSLTWDRY
jgi:plastocyanin